MPDFISLSCPSCGANLQITEDIDRFSCTHCGKEHIVKRGGGIVSVSPVVNGLKEVKVGVDKTASELALTRLEKELSDLYVQLEAVEEEKFTGKNLVGCSLIFGIVLLLISILSKTTYLAILGIIILLISFLPRIFPDIEQDTALSRIQEEINNKEKEIMHHKDLVSK